MTLDDVRQQLEALAKIIDDPEVAHGREDELHQAVLAAIAAGECDNPRACAEAALETTRFAFARWYA